MSFKWKWSYELNLLQPPSQRVWFTSGTFFQVSATTSRLPSQTSFSTFLPPAAATVMIWGKTVFLVCQPPHSPLVTSDVLRELFCAVHPQLTVQLSAHPPLPLVQGHCCFSTCIVPSFIKKKNPSESRVSKRHRFNLNWIMCLDVFDRLEKVQTFVTYDEKNTFKYH